MAKFGKWIGGGLGWVLGGPIGGVLGFVFGSMFDGINSGDYAYEGGGERSHPYSQDRTQYSQQREETQAGDFAIVLLVLSAAIMKADGRVKKTELDFVKNFFVSRYGIEKTKQNMQVLKEMLQQELPLAQITSQVKHYMDYSSKLQLIHYLFGISMSDDHIHDREVEVIDYIAANIGVDRPDFNSIKAMFLKDEDDLYTILDVDKNVSDEELKRAYKKMAIKYHPDKVSHLGEDVRKEAEQKFQTLNNAYDQIKKQRGIK
jgi:DnaJ like chaperone protein